MTELLLVRHGETVGNVAQVLQGQMQGALNDNGRHQAEMVADQLRDAHIDVFVSSDLQRSLDTCRIIATSLGRGDEEIFTTPLLRERDWGDFTGMLIPDLKDKIWPDNVESLGQMKERAQQFMQLMRKRYPGKTVLAVGHGIINKAVQSVYFHKPMNEIQKMSNAEVRRFEL